MVMDALGPARVTVCTVSFVYGRTRLFWDGRTGTSRRGVVSPGMLIAQQSGRQPGESPVEVFVAFSAAHTVVGTPEVLFFGRNR